MDNWYKDWFGSDLYLSVYSHRNEEDAKQLCNLILNTTKLGTGSNILDAACGAGRHANYLSSIGYQVTGFDLSKTLLNIAHEDAIQRNLKTKFICADIRNVCFKNQFDSVVNLFTSFGYFFNDDENFLFIKNAFELLRPGGFYVLDYLNPELVKKSLVKESVKEINGIQVLERRRIQNNRVEKEILIAQDGIEKKYFETVALYSPETLIKTIASFGYKLHNTFGDYLGNNYEEDISPRLLLVFQR